MTAPRVSVLLPCRDVADTVGAAVDSLASQTYTDFEVVAVDDGSTDRTGEILRRRAGRDRRVRVLDGGRGLVPSLRLASEAARAPLLARMDGDDLAHPRRLERQVARLEARPGLAACGTGVLCFPRPALGSGLRRYERWINSLRTPGQLRRDLLVECPVAHPTLMIRARALRAVGGYRDRGWPEDYDLLLRLHLAGLSAANLPERLLRWRHDPGRLSLTSPRYSADAFRRCRVHFLLAGLLPADRPAVVWGAGRVGKAFAREMARQGRPAAAFVDVDPRKVGQEIHGMRVLPPEGLDDRPEAYVLAAVGAPGARRDIRERLAAAGRGELVDFRAVA